MLSNRIWHWLKVTSPYELCCIYEEQEDKSVATESISQITSSSSGQVLKSIRCHRYNHLDSSRLPRACGNIWDVEKKLVPSIEKKNHKIKTTVFKNATWETVTVIQLSYFYMHLIKCGLSVYFNMLDMRWVLRSIKGL